MFFTEAESSSKLLFQMKLLLLRQPPVYLFKGHINFTGDSKTCFAVYPPMCFYNNHLLPYPFQPRQNQTPFNSRTPDNYFAFVAVVFFPTSRWHEYLIEGNFSQTWCKQSIPEVVVGSYSKAQESVYSIFN